MPSQCAGSDVFDIPLHSAYTLVVSNPTKSLAQFGRERGLSKRVLQQTVAQVRKKIEVEEQALQYLRVRLLQARVSPGTSPGGLRMLEIQIAAIEAQVAEYRRMLGE